MIRFRNKNVEKVNERQSLQKQSASEELQEITMECNSLRRNKKQY